MVSISPPAFEKCTPLLANIYLHWFEKAFHQADGPATWANAKIVRYADDFVVLARYLGPRLTTWIESQLEGRFRLTINRTKTRVVNLRQPGAALDFLRFTFRYGYPSKAFHAVNKFVLDRLQRHLCRRSQRRFRRPADQTWYALLQSLGLQLLSARTTPGRACLPADRSRGSRMR